MASHASIAAIVLAAGRSTRMGNVNKLLVDFDGKAMISQSVERVTGLGLSETLVVTGYQQQEVQAALSGFGVRFVENADYRKGLSTSLKVGIRALGGDIDGALVVLGDMPLVEKAVLKCLTESFKSTSDICTVSFAGKRGNPVLWGRDYFDEILQLTGDTGARMLLEKHSPEVRTMEVETDSVLRDFDSPGDFVSGR